MTKPDDNLFLARHEHKDLGILLVQVVRGLK